jgi:hypothetical protein
MFRVSAHSVDRETSAVISDTSNMQAYIFLLLLKYENLDAIILRRKTVTYT